MGIEANNINSLNAGQTKWWLPAANYYETWFATSSFHLSGETPYPVKWEFLEAFAAFGKLEIPKTIASYVSGVKRNNEEKGFESQFDPKKESKLRRELERNCPEKEQAGALCIKHIKLLCEAATTSTDFVCLRLIVICFFLLSRVAEVLALQPEDVIFEFDDNRRLKKAVVHIKSKKGQLRNGSTTVEFERLENPHVYDCGNGKKGSVWRAKGLLTG
jgi:hypothetical protein